MLDTFIIFSKSGLVLFQYSPVVLDSDPINALIGSILLEERGGSESSFTYGPYTLRWNFANQYDLVFVAVYQKLLNLKYVADLLRLVNFEFCQQFASSITKMQQEGDWDVCQEFSNFMEDFEVILHGLEKKDRLSASQRNAPREFGETKRGKKVLSNKKIKPTTNSDDVDHDSNEPEKVAMPKRPLTIQERRRLIAAKRAGGSKKKSKKKKGGGEKKNTVPKKKAKKWDDYIPDVQRHVTKAEQQELDFSSSASQDTLSINNGEDAPSRQDFNFELSDSSSDDDEVALVDSMLANADSSKVAASSSGGQKQNSVVSKKGGFFSKWLPSLTGRPIEQDDIAPALVEFQQHLKAKNVAADISEKLCESIGQSLIGQTLPSFTRVVSVVRESLEKSLVRILTPKRSIDILRDALECKANGRPYVITFCGVNGVGKSTSLAKIASWLRANDLNVLIVACDSFRSGAVEQLEVHAKRIGVPLFEKGYGKNITKIAESAIMHAKKTKETDVILIDTAGRMQDNLELMKALCNLVEYNEPDLVLFVGEALVGNDGVDQLVKFNDAMRRLARKKAAPRLIDGIILTKFDTIDDKVGAALSMVYTTGQPIVFLGTGQNYSDLKKMNVQAVIKALLK